MMRQFRLLIPAAVIGVTLVAGGHAQAAGRFDEPGGIAVDRQGNVYVADSGDARILKLSPDGRLLRAWEQRGVSFAGGSPVGIGVDRYGNVYVTDEDNATVVKYGPRGGLVAQWGRAGDGEFNSPQGLAVGPRGSIFVADTENDSVEKLTPRGRVLNVWSFADPVGSGQYPQWIAAGPDGRIYTTTDGDCPGCYAIQQRASDGSLLASWQYDDSLAGVAVGGRGNIFVVDGDAAAVIKLAPDGQELVRWSVPTDVSGGLTGIALDARGDIYLTDSYDNRVIKLSSTGHVLSIWT